MARFSSFALFFIVPVLITAQIKFEPHQITTPSGYQGWIYDLETADLDNDGNMDIVVGGYGESLAWYKNDGAGNFTNFAIASQPAFTRPIRSVHVVDLDQDGNLDVLSASSSDDRINWYKNSGTNPITWTTSTITTSADEAYGVFAADFNADGNIDVVSASVGDGKISWYRNMGGAPPTWTEHVIVTSSSADRSVIAVDVDNDGDQDIISAHNDMVVYLNDGTTPIPGFVQSNLVTGVSENTHMAAYVGDPATWPFPSYARQKIDFNSDGLVDIVSGRSSDKIRIYENQGLPTTNTYDLTLTNPYRNPNAVQVADLDSDGDLDVISTTNESLAAIHLNTGSYSFKSIPVSTGDRTKAVAVADFNNDNQLDLVVGKEGGPWDEPLVWLEGEEDNTPATVTHVTSPQVDGTYGIGDIIPVEVHFSETPIAVTGTPQLTLDLDGTPKIVNYYSSRDSIMTFHYTVASGETSSDLDYSSTSALALNSGSIKAFGNDATVALPPPGSAQSIGGSKALIIDTDAPEVVSVSSTVADGIYGPGDVIPVTVTFDNQVYPTGNFLLDANWTTNQGTDGGTIMWQSFTAENTAQLTRLDIYSKSPLKGRSAAGTLKIYSGEGNATPQLIHSQDVTFLNQSISWRTYYLTAPVSVTAGDQYTWEVSTSKSEQSWLSIFYSNAYSGGRSSNDVNRDYLFKTYVETVPPDIELTLETGVTDAVLDLTAGSGTNILSFDYQVATDHVSSDLDYETTASLVLQSGTLIDAGRNNASLVLAPPGAPNSLGGNKNINLDTEPPDLTFDPLDGTANVPQNHVVLLTFSDDVRKVDDGPLDNANIDAMIDLKKDDATSGVDAASNIDVTWDAGNNRISIAHDDFPSEQVVYAALKPNMIEDLYNNVVPAENVTFTVVDALAPTIVFSPDDGATAVSLSTDITITFGEAIRNENDSALDDNNVDARITLKINDANGNALPFDATIDAAKKIITVDPNNDFLGEQDIYICIDDEVEDFSNNAISDSCVTFSTEDVAPPVVTFVPSNGTVDVPKDVVISINFNEAVRNTDDSALDDNNVDALITLNDQDASGTSIPFDASIRISRKTITIIPTNNFVSEQQVYVCIEPVEDASDNATFKECATFTTADISAANIAIDPANSATNVEVDKLITITSTEPLRQLDNSALDDNNIDRYLLLRENSATGTDISFDATIDPGYALSFDGGDDYVDINAIADDMAGLTDWAVSFWAKPTKASFPENDAYVLANNCDNGSTNCNKILFGIRNNGIVTVFEEPGGVTIAGSATNDGSWNHIIYSRTGTTGALYLNGSADGTHTPSHADFVASDKWSIGHEWDGTTVTNEFVGSIDEVAVWNDALAANEVTALFNSGVALDATTNSGDYTSSANLVGYWRMQDGTGTTVTDLSGNSNDGTIGGDPLWITTSSIVSVDPTSDFLSEQTVYVDICCVEDEDGNLIATTSSTFTTADVDPPTVSFDPADGETDVLVDKEITLTFSEPIQNIDDSDITNNNVEVLIALKDTDANGSNINLSSVEINNAKTVITIQAAADFSSEQKVYVAILDKVVEDDANNAIDLTSAIFTIEDKAPPTITFFPLDAATGVPINTIPTITFNEPVFKSDASVLTNNNVSTIITFKETDANGANIDLASATINNAKTVITLTPVANFTSEGTVFMCIDPVEDGSGNESIQQCASFNTSDVILPTVTWNPINGSIDVPVSAVISLKLDEAVRNLDNSALDNSNVDGLILLNEDDVNGAPIGFDAIINASKDSITINPTNLFGSEVTVHAAIGTSLEDDQDNAILASSTTFITKDSEPPEVAFAPSEGSTNIGVDSVITLTFGEAVRLIDGTAMDNDNVVPLITLEEVANNPLIFSGGNEPVLDTKVFHRYQSEESSFMSVGKAKAVEFNASVSNDKKVITITPKANLKSEQTYKVSIGATVEDLQDNAINPASSTFSTTDAKPPSVTFNPADGDTGVSISTDITITFDEAIRYLNDAVVTTDNVASIITLKEEDSSGENINYTAVINDPKTVITVTLNEVLKTRQTVYIAISPQVEDDVNNAIVEASATFSTEESPKIIVSDLSPLFTTEGGGKSTFSLSLGKKPTADVVVAIMSQDESEGKASISGITFKKQLWDEVQEVEVIGQDDEIDDGDVPYVIGLMGVVSDDSRYNGVDPEDVSLINRDDSDEAKITVMPRRGLETTEAASKDSFSIKLESEPIATVTIPLDNTKPEEGSLSSNSLVFKPSDWNVFQTVMVTGLNDSVVDGDRTYKIITRKPVTDDSVYASINPADIVVTNRAREPIMLATADSLKFGRVPRDAFSVQSFDVINIGTDTLRVSNIKLSSSVFVTGEQSGFKVAPKDTFTVFIQFLPEEPMSYVGQYRAKHNDTSQGELKVDLSGEAFKPVLATNDTVVDFGRVFVFFDEEQPLSIYNAGNSDLRIDSLIITGKQFSAPELKGIYLKPNDTTHVNVTFSSPKTGKAKGNVRIFSNDQDRPREDIPILATILPPDTLGPEFHDINITPGDVRLRQFVSVNTELADDNLIEEAVLYFLQGGESQYTAYPMMTQDSVNYNFVSKAADVTLKGIAFYVLARDERGNMTLSDTISPPVNFTNGSLTTTVSHSSYPDGIPKKLWRLISIPAGLDEPDVVTNFSDDLGGKPNSRKWRIFQPSSNSGESLWSQPKVIETGKSYWLIQDVKKQPHLSTGSGETIPLSGFDITFQPGWNLIGSPYAFPIASTLDPSSFYGPLSYGAQNEGWSLSDSLLPWGGYIVYSRESESVNVSINPLESGPEATTRTLARKNEVGEWKLRVGVTGRTYADEENFIGRTLLAEEGPGKFDNPEPPYMEGYISVVFDGKDLRNKPLALSSDFRSSYVRNGIWDGAIKVKGEKGPITMSFDLAGSFPEEDAILLLDITTRQEYNLLEKSLFEIKNYSEEFPYRFKVFSGSPEFVASAMADALSVLPDEFALRQNYPNPFNPSTTIEFTIPQPSEISLVIYNLMGQEVRTLKRGMLDTGHHSILWHGKDDRGQLVSSGVYLVRFFTPKFTTSRKMVLMK